MIRILEVVKKVNVKYLLAECGARYWEDATVDGIEDTNGDLIPCREGAFWKPLIDIDKGIIVNWEKGKTAKIHYKVCDNGTYTLLDENKEVITKISGYVPKIMCPGDTGFGDYVIMRVDGEGKIDKWGLYPPPLSEFLIYI
ncbi:hypothetical protein ACQ1Q1_09115 [Ornithobacterium rhinotracheale]|uniref:Uncharacterized protein n=2 Tax=Ornithobacterium rhinotracheale TaxID=28251 RepID=I4A365_ORNRL|nr:hypothetical protein [Ornithobacterium rhinotracheale]AFL98399.1 hypothetical protein Ornrh_2268 [Ornithobacterium rhinotracheale DSM 15997]AIQ00142.1 hypothetical protein Q785_11490 [Ornithobacterium rhinotracheale ORT-UMN 88]KGB65737.1 hypothetical protein Q787_11020 [Ornithobacterium rhinotracheale H06-030791]MBN3662835.1 hypothetical protein [Ornithobacterium rhinotracheale]MCK0193253.1 hypothetical protein [Ornithobacterium rhinotracheale]